MDYLGKVNSISGTFAGEASHQVGYPNLTVAIYNNFIIGIGPSTSTSEYCLLWLPIDGSRCV
jgi:hypothetical protein